MFGDGDGTLVVGGGTIVVPSIQLGYERPATALMLHRADRLVLDVAYDEAPGAYAYLDRQHTHEYTALAVSAVRGADGIRLAATGAGPHGLRLPSAEAKADDPEAAGQAALADVQLADDAVASAWYREQTLPILVRRALEQLREAA